MSKPIRFAAGVEAELDGAAVWVEADREGMGLELIAAVRHAIDASPNVRTPGRSYLMGMERGPTW